MERSDEPAVNEPQNHGYFLDAWPVIAAFGLRCLQVQSQPVLQRDRHADRRSFLFEYQAARYRLAELAPRHELIFDLPSRLADDLAAGRLDVALIPSIEYFQHPDYTSSPTPALPAAAPFAA